MGSPVRTGLTVADLARFEGDDRHKYELVDGELFVSPKGQLRHQYVALRLARRLLEWADAHGGVAFAEADVYYSDRDYVIPDAVLVSAQTLAVLDEHGPLDVAPDLVVEVSSPSTRRLDRVVKRALYEREGVPEYWFADLDAGCIEVYRLTEAGRYAPPERAGAGAWLRPAHLPGLAVAVDDVLRPMR